MTSTGTEIALSLSTALAAGMLIGAERQQESRSFGGARTFALVALGGAIAMLVDRWLAAALGLGLVALISITHYRDSSARSDAGATTEVVALLTYALGALCTALSLPIPYSDRLLLVMAGASATLAMLSIKKTLHGFLSRVSEVEVIAITKLLLLMVVLLPLLPYEYIGPWDAINPRIIGMLAVLISAINFAGYIAMRVLGPHKGLGLTGLLGGLASSTAVTLSFAGRAREHRAFESACALAIVLATATMYPRMLVDVSVISPELIPVVGWPLVGAALTAFLSAYVLMVLSKRDMKMQSASAPEVKMQNPFSLARALKFTGLLVTIVLASRALTEYFDTAGTYLAAVLAGSINVDAVTLSIANLYMKKKISSSVAVDSIGVIAGSSTAVKIGLSTVLGGWGLGLRVGAALSMALFVGFVLRLIVL